MIIIIIIIVCFSKKNVKNRKRRFLKRKCGFWSPCSPDPGKDIKGVFENVLKFKEHAYLGGGGAVLVYGTPL